MEIRNAQLLEFLEENPGATAKDVEEWARNGDKPREEKGVVRWGRISSCFSTDAEVVKGLGGFPGGETRLVLLGGIVGYAGLIAIILRFSG